MNMKWMALALLGAVTSCRAWQGAGHVEIDDSLLKMGVSHMLADFPAKAAAGVATEP